MSNSFPAILRQMNALCATGLFLSKDKTPACRVNSNDTQPKAASLNTENLALFTISATTKDTYQQFLQKLEINICNQLHEIDRLIFSAFFQRQNIFKAIRAILSHIPSPIEQRIPRSVTNLVNKNRGLTLEKKYTKNPRNESIHLGIIFKKT